MVGSEYEISGANCADFSSDVAPSVGIDVKKPQRTVAIRLGKAVISKTFTACHEQVTEAKNLDGANVKKLDKLREANEDEDQTTSTRR